MDKLNIMNAYDLIKELKTYLCDCKCEYKITLERVSDDFVYIEWEAPTGEDGLPAADYSYGNSSIFDGRYILDLSIKDNIISFFYYTAGYSSFSLWPKVGRDESGKPIYSSFENKFEIESVIRERNDRENSAYLPLRYSVVEDRDGRDNRLVFWFGIERNFNNLDTFERFKEEFYKGTMAVLQSKETAEFIKNKILKYFWFNENRKTLLSL